jgi:hypothetical protein
VLGLIISVFFATLGGAVSLVQFGVGSTLDSWEFWKPALLVLAVTALSWGLLWMVCVALITPPSANRARPLRVYLSFTEILTGLGVLMWSYGSKSQHPVLVWQVAWSCLLALSFLTAVCERETPGPRVLRAVPSGGVARLRAFLTFSGAASGLAWTCLASCFTLGLAWLWRNSHGGYSEVEDLQTALTFGAGMLLYFYAYAVSGALVRRGWLNWLQPQWTWTLSLILLGLGTFLPVLIGFFFYYGEWGHWEKKGLVIGNPFVFGNSTHDSYYAGFAVAFALLVTLLNARWLRARWEAFQPPACALPEEINS